MKKPKERDCYTRMLSSKAIRVMKITTLLILLFVYSLSASTYAQSQKVSMAKQNSSILEILKEIEETSEFTFFYNDNYVDVNKKTSLDVKNATLDEVLNHILKNTGYDYQIIDRQVLIKASDARRVTTSQQVKTITGVITDDTGEPVIGANVAVKGTTNGTITDADGKFTLQVPAGAILAVSYIGYTSRDIVVGNNASLQITLIEDSKALEEVVVVGYGVARKKDLTGSVGTVKGDELSNRKTTQLSSALQGAVSGLMVSRSNAAPGSFSTIKVRGVTTITENASDPLYIIDGVPGDINQVNPNDVESISVLKDAASASIYGSRAAAGVILITTKRAGENDLNINYSFEYGFELPTMKPEYVGVQRFLEMTNELRWNDAGNGDNRYPQYTKDQVDNWVKYNATDPDKYPITDWQKMMLKSSAPRSSHVVSLSGGSKAVKTKASFGFDQVDGLYENREYERYMVRVNNDLKLNKYMGATLDVNFQRAKTLIPAFDTELNTEKDPIRNNKVTDRMRVAAPVYAAVWADGRIAEGKSGSNPYALLMEGGTYTQWHNQIGGKASLFVTPIEGLRVSGIIAPVYNFDKRKKFSKAVPYYLANDPTTLGGYMEAHATTKLTENRNDNYNVTTQFIANYMKDLGSHSLNLMAGYENYYEFFEEMMASRDQYELTGYPYLDLGPQTLRDNSGKAYETAYQSWFGRVMYSFKDRYLLQANIRADASSRFHKDYRWGSFPSFSAGWVMSEESFIKNAGMDWLSFLKLRASWGTLGNERIGRYPYQSTIAFGNALFYQNGNVLSQLTAAQQKYAIQNITWEKTESVDFGLDANFLNNRLRLVADYYHKTTKDMLLALEIPDYIGFENPNKNTGKMNTKGYEMEISWNDVAGDWSYGVSVNYSDFVSKMGDLGGTEFLEEVKVKKKGSEFNEWYGYMSDGLYQNAQDVENSPKINQNIKPGDVKYRDISGPDGVPDGIISPEYDRVLLGGSLPRHVFGGNVRVGYKNIDFSMAFYGVGKQLVRLDQTMIQPLRESWGHIPAILEGEYWSMNNTADQNMQAKYPRLTYSNAGSNYTMSDYWLFNGRFIRMKNLTIGYTIPTAITQKLALDRVRFYAAANDLFSFSKYPKGWDPEMGSASYPITTSVLFGISVNFK